MAGYAAVVSAMQTILRLESSRIRFVAPCGEILDNVYVELYNLHGTLQRLDKRSPSKSRKKVNGLDGRIKEAVWEFEDLLESHLSDHILSQDIDVPLFSVDLRGQQHQFVSFIETLKGLHDEYLHELLNMPVVEDDELGSSGDDFDGIMVGLTDDFEDMKSRLTDKNDHENIFILYGMAGVGKTNFARKLYEDTATLRFFEHRVWITVGRKYQFSDMARAILAQVDPDNFEIAEGDAKISEYLEQKFDGKRCLIVVDDVWEKQVFMGVRSLMPNMLLRSSIKILFTTRDQSIARNSYYFAKWIRLLRIEESKDLLRRKVFGEGEIPWKLEKAAEKIAEYCEGLPLMVVKVGDRLSKAKNYDPEYWNEVADKRSSIFTDAYNEMTKVLFPTYDCLPQQAKMILIYVGAFPQDYEIPVSMLINLLVAERFSNVNNLNHYFILGNEYSWFLNDKVIVKKWTSDDPSSMKRCRVYSWWRPLLNREAFKDKFLCIINSVVHCLEEAIKGQRRLCLHSNFLFNFKRVYDCVQRDCPSSARSLLCFGPYHPYSMPIYEGFKLLRVLDALKVRFYNFPIEILNLVLLGYLALTYNGKLPTSISKLANLQFLIIHPHMNIKSFGAPSPSYLPVQIWDMQELQHIEILGSNLPKPKHSDASLQKLSKLLGVSANSCTGEVLKKLPNVRELGIRIELAPGDDDNAPLSTCFDHISELENLETLKCSVINPQAKYSQIPLSMFPSTLKTLYLSGLGYPWKHMEVIGSLPNLDSLKLQCYAFQGPKWETKGKHFPCLRHLVIEDTDLVQWKPSSESFPWLHHLTIRSCYKLQELHWPSDSYGWIKLVDCNPLAVVTRTAKQPRKNYENLRVVCYFEGKEHRRFELA